MTKTQEQAKQVEIKETTILKLQAKDLEEYNQGRKSYKLINWLKDELALNAYVNNWHTLKIVTSAKALSKLIVILALMREQNQINIKNINILDKETTEILCLINLDELNNAYRRYLNLTYNTNIEMREEQAEIDDFTSHSITLEKINI